MKTNQIVNDAPQRRSHLIRRVGDKGIRITDLDISDIFEPLSRYAQLTTRQLVAFGTRHPIITKARLSELWHCTAGERSHWLHRLNEDVLFANHLYVEDLHRLGREAEALLILKKLIVDEAWINSSKIGGNSTMPSRIIRLAHDHMASDIILDIEIGARAAKQHFQSHLAILRAAPEEARNARKPLQIPVTLNGHRSFVEPDALFKIGSRAFALEADKGTESIKAVIVPKILAYREIVANRMIDAHLGLDNLCVLFATTNAIRMQNIMEELSHIARNGRSPMFAFRCEPDFGAFLKSPSPTGRLFRAPWQRVGHEDLILAELR